MYIPTSNKVDDLALLQRHIKSHPFGTWSALADGEIVVNHIPFLLYEKRGEFGTLVGHVARANNIWQNVERDKTSVVVFHGEQAYISPSWYPSKHNDGKSVPTWNYSVVHASGVPVLHEDAEWLMKHVTELTNLHETHQPQPWKVGDAPADYTDALLKAIVGVEIPITQLVGKYKLGQNRSEADQLGLVSGLMSCPDAQSQALAQLSKEVLLLK